MLLGIPEYVEGNPGRYYNSVMSFGVSPTQIYRKHHLVPFGDYFPQWTFITWVMSAMQIPMSSFSRGDAVQAPLAVAGQHVAVNICYEDVFGEEIDPPAAARDYAGQLHQRRLVGRVHSPPSSTCRSRRCGPRKPGAICCAPPTRGSPRSSISAGGCSRRRPQFVTTAVDGIVQGYVGSTPYVRWGNWVVLGLIAAMLAVAVALRGRR